MSRGGHQLENGRAFWAEAVAACVEELGSFQELQIFQDGQNRVKKTRVELMVGIRGVLVSCGMQKSTAVDNEGPRV